MPAYNAARTLKQTYDEVCAQEIVDLIILVDDASRDNTVHLARSLEKIQVHVHDTNKGYGANQKTCYRLALEAGGDIIIMIHPDYQYTPKLLVAMGSLVALGQYHVVLGSRILCQGALKGGMPLYKYVANRILTFIQNLLLGMKLSEYHTGYRAFSRDVLRTLPLEENSEDFLFDNQMLVQSIHFGFPIGEISCPARYFEEASSIDFGRSVFYGMGVLKTSFQFFLQRLGLWQFRIFSPRGEKVDPYPGAT